MREHPNQKMCLWLENLPKRYARAAIQQIQLQCFGSEGVSQNTYWAVKNWQQGKSLVPREYHHRINQIARNITRSFLNDLYAGASEDQITVTNLFTNEDTMKQKTTIFLERARKRVSQEQLAEAVGTSNNTISKLENGKYGSVKLDLATKIAKYFGLQIADFQEFQIEE